MNADDANTVVNHIDDEMVISFLEDRRDPGSGLTLEEMAPLINPAVLEASRQFVSRKSLPSSEITFQPSMRKSDCWVRVYVPRPPGSNPKVSHRRYDYYFIGLEGKGKPVVRRTRKEMLDVVAEAKLSRRQQLPVGNPAAALQSTSSDDGGSSRSGSSSLRRIMVRMD